MKLADWREAKGWTQAELAAELGCDALAVYRYETNRRMPRDERMLEKIFLVTEGKVEPNDFYPVALWREKLGELLDAARKLLRSAA